MFTVYVLHSPSSGKIYVGFTSNLQQRILSHNQLGKKGWTIKYRPWRLVMTEVFDDKKSAMTREKQLKGAKGREWIWNLINSQMQA